MSHFDISHGHLSLVWSNPLAEKPKSQDSKKNTPPEASKSAPSKLDKIVDSTVYKILSPLIAIVASAVIAIYSAGWQVGWQLGSIHTDIENLKNQISGPDGLTSRMLNVEKSVGTTNGIKEAIDKRLENLEKELGEVRNILFSTYRQKAVALGLKEPSIIPIKFDPSQSVIQEAKQPFPYHLEIRFLQVTETQIIFRVDGYVTGKVVKMTKFSDARLAIPLRIPSSVQLIGPSSPVIKGDFPAIYVIILATPTKGIAILAIGPKTSISS